MAERCDETLIINKDNLPKLGRLTKVCVPDCSLQIEQTATVKYGSRITLPVKVKIN